MTPHPTLVADIGGTHARFGLLAAPGGRIADIQTLCGADYPSPQAAALAYLQGRRIGRAALAVAAAVALEPVTLTNSPWRVSGVEIAQALQLSREQLKLLNDFEALALALPYLDAQAQHSLCAGTPKPQQTLAVLGPGTGLGVAGCVPCPVQGTQSWLALATEGGHATLCAGDDFEAQVLHVLRRAYPAHVSAERVISGTGLPLLHRAVCEVMGFAHHAMIPSTITELALADTDPSARLTITTFCAMLGNFAGNVALTLGARGGVYLAGGVTLAILPLLEKSQFRARFEAKGRYQAYLADIATAVVVDPHAALLGAAAAFGITD
jgi:glucokinase